MIRIIRVFLIVIFIFTVIFFQTAHVAYAKAKVLKLGHVFTANHPMAMGAEVFKEFVDKESNGRLEVKIFPNAQLGGIRAMEDSCRAGIQEIAQSCAPTLQVLYDVIAVFTLPYTFRSEEHLRHVVNGDIGREIYQGIIDKVGIRPIATIYQLPRHLTSNVWVKSAADLKGLKIRVPEVPSWVAFWKKLGASPVPIDSAEMYTSLQLGIVNAQENPYNSILQQNLYEVQKYLIPTGHVRTLDWYMINNNLLKSLPKDLQEVILRGGEKMADYINSTWSATSESARQELLAKGMKLIEPDHESFRKAQEGFYKQFLKPELQELYEKMQAVK